MGILSSFAALVPLLLLLVRPDSAAAGALGVGTVGSTPSESVARLAPLADYLARKLEASDIDRGRVVVAESVPEMAALIERGEVDLYFGDPMPAMALREIARVELRLRCSRQETRTVVFAKKGGGVGALEDLGGKVIAFESPVSTFGYLLPKLFLTHKGARLQRRDVPSGPIDAGTVAYVFSADDENTVVWVLRDKVAAGAVRSDRYQQLAGGRPDTLAEVYRSDPLPAAVVCIRSTMPAGLMAKLLKILQDMSRDPEGRELMRTLTGADGCEPLTEDVLSPLQNVQPFLRSELGLQ